MQEEEDILLYHPKYSRPLRGCLGHFILLAVAVVAAILVLVKVLPPDPMPPTQEGTLHYRNDELLHMQALMHSPLPLPLPRYVDPARRDAAAAQELPSRFVPKLSQAPAERIFSAAHDSAVLDAAALIALPPEGMRDTPPTADGEEVQP